VWRFGQDSEKRATWKQKVNIGGFSQQIRRVFAGAAAHFGVLPQGLQEISRLDPVS